MCRIKNRRSCQVNGDYVISQILAKYNLGCNSLIASAVELCGAFILDRRLYDGDVVSCFPAKTFEESLCCLVHFKYPVLNTFNQRFGWLTPHLNVLFIPDSSYLWLYTWCAWETLDELKSVICAVLFGSLVGGILSFMRLVPQKDWVLYQLAE